MEIMAKWLKQYFNRVSEKNRLPSKQWKYKEDNQKFYDRK